MRRQSTVFLSGMRYLLLHPSRGSLNRENSLRQLSRGLSTERSNPNDGRPQVRIRIDRRLQAKILKEIIQQDESDERC